MPHDQRAPFVRESEASKLEWSRYMGSQGRVRKRKMKVQLPVVEQRDPTPSQASASVSSRVSERGGPEWEGVRVGAWLEGVVVFRGWHCAHLPAEACQREPARSAAQPHLWNPRSSTS